VGEVDHRATLGVRLLEAGPPAGTELETDGVDALRVTHLTYRVLR
jgi:hypothetical protein